MAQSILYRLEEALKKRGWTFLDPQEKKEVYLEHPSYIVHREYSPVDWTVLWWRISKYNLTIDIIFPSSTETGNYCNELRIEYAELYIKNKKVKGYQFFIPNIKQDPIEEVNKFLNKLDQF
ncbi:hypothetical protein [Tenacibaculum sp. M341]|uniref:hypothetical protein n=1 Tax=Tenacibaculum sp. M341 TaxID=2530339 RepID=UPI00104B4BCF|nr:hypothetical protein [Tenacibaculum sp. M341]TCI90596.1 hypothetical protein EYW44_12780 [Tenacibaculum sp. M341]